MLLFCSLVTIVLWLAYNSCVDAQHGNNYLTSCTYQYGVNLCIPRKYIYAIRICVQFVRVDFAGFGVIFITPDSVRPAQKVGPSAHAHRSLCSMRSKTIRLCSIVAFHRLNGATSGWAGARRCSSPGVHQPKSSYKWQCKRTREVNSVASDWRSCDRVTE